MKRCQQRAHLIAPMASLQDATARGGTFRWCRGVLRSPLNHRLQAVTPSGSARGVVVKAGRNVHASRRLELAHCHPKEISLSSDNVRKAAGCAALQNALAGPLMPLGNFAAWHSSISHPARLETSPCLFPRHPGGMPAYSRWLSARSERHHRLPVPPREHLEEVPATGALTAPVARPSGCIRARRGTFRWCRGALRSPPQPPATSYDPFGVRARGRCQGRAQRPRQPPPGARPLPSKRGLVELRQRQKSGGMRCTPKRTSRSAHASFSS